MGRFVAVISSFGRSAPVAYARARMRTIDPNETSKFLHTGHSDLSKETFGYRCE